MKKVIYLFAFMAAVFTSCEPLEDINAEIDALPDDPNVGEFEYTLIGDDYERFDLGFGNFSSQQQAKDSIPLLLSELYPLYGEGSSVLVNYNLYDPMVFTDYTLTDEDYDALLASGEISNASLNSGSDIRNALEFLYPTAEIGDYVNLTYKTLADQIMYTLTDADYALVGNGTYNNFDIREGADEETVEARRAKIQTILLNNFPDTAVGQQYSVTYAAYNNSNIELTMLLEFNGTNYSIIELTSYTLTFADFSAIGVAFETEYPEPAASASNYGNFDRRPDEDAYWSNDMILEALNEILPAADEGDRYNVTYAIYNGASGTETMSLEYQSGAYIAPAQLLLDKTSTYAVTTSGWELPYTVSEEDYEIMGQSFENFDENSIYKLAIYLEQLYPFAQEGDVKAIMYEYYDGSTSDRFSNYRFDGDQWMIIGNVVEMSLKFGFKDGVWVPDNTIRYTVSQPEFDYIAENYATDPIYEAAVSSMASYGNFDRRPANAAYWSDEMILTVFADLLNNVIAPEAENEQKYVMVVDIYDGSNGTEEFSLIKLDGAWVYNTEE